MNIQNEIWRDAVGYAGLYQVSNMGRVKSLARVDRFGRVVPERILRPQKTKKGYLQIQLWKVGKMKCLKVHRLVAQVFIPNPDNLTQVNHKDENKENNFVFVREDGSVDFNKSNLEWITLEGNLKYGTHDERMAKTKSKPVAQKTKNGELIKIWSSAKEVERQLGWSRSSISLCCNGYRKSAYDFIWQFVNYPNKYQ